MKHFQFFGVFLALFLSTRTWADSTVNYTFVDDLRSDWSAHFFALDKARIASNLGLTEDELTSKFSPSEGKNTVVCYSLGKDGSSQLLVPTSNVTGSAGYGGYFGWWVNAEGKSFNSTQRYYYVFDHQSFKVGIGQNGSSVSYGNIKYGSTLAFTLYVKYTPENGEAKTETINVNYKVLGTDAGAYTFYDSPLHNGYAVTYTDIEHGKIASALGLSADEFASAYKADNSGSVKLCAYKADGTLAETTNAGGNKGDKGYWLGADGCQCSWKKGVSYIYFTYDAPGKIGVGQMSTADQGNVKLGDSLTFYVVFKNEGKRAVVTFNYVVNTLDEAWSFTPVDGNFDNIHLKRSFVKGWNTLSLPFDLDREQLQTVFGSDAKTAEFSNTDGNNVNFSTATGGLKANVPVLLWLDNAGDDYTFNNVVMETSSTLQADGNTWLLKGNYNAESNLAENDYILSGNQWWKNSSTSNYKVKGFRAFISYAGASSAAKQMNLTIDNHSLTTSIDDISVKQNSRSEMFNLGGVRVNGQYRGVVLQNGKKYIRK